MQTKTPERSCSDVCFSFGVKIAHAECARATVAGDDTASLADDDLFEAMHLLDALTHAIEDLLIKTGGINDGDVFRIGGFRGICDPAPDCRRR